MRKRQPAGNRPPTSQVHHENCNSKEFDYTNSTTKEKRYGTESDKE